jgi:hypothetical protein
MRGREIREKRDKGGEKMKKVFFISLLFIFWFILVPWALLVFEMNKIIRRSEKNWHTGKEKLLRKWWMSVGVLFKGEKNLAYVERISQLKRD